MVSSGRRTPHTLIGAADRCCPAVCDYNTTMVRLILNIIDGLERRGEDAGTDVALGSFSRGEGGRGASCGSGLAHLGVKVWDIQQVLKRMGTTASRADATEVARRLCPWALDDLPTEDA